MLAAIDRMSERMVAKEAKRHLNGIVNGHHLPGGYRNHKSRLTKKFNKSLLLYQLHHYGKLEVVKHVIFWKLFEISYSQEFENFIRESLSQFIEEYEDPYRDVVEELTIVELVNDFMLFLSVQDDAINFADEMELFTR